MVNATTSLTSPAAATPAISPAAPATDRETTRQLRTAVSQLNEGGVAGPGREFAFSIDPKSKIAIVKIVDSGTRELIEQIPSQYILDLAQHLNPQTPSNFTDTGR